MFIQTESEINSLMPTARWNRPEQLKGYLEEEERVALEPLLGTELYEFLCQEYERLRETYVDITSQTVSPVCKAKSDPGQPYADVTDRLDHIQSQAAVMPQCHMPIPEDTDDVPEEDMLTIRLIRICQQIEFYKMLSHKTGLLTVSFNEGGGMNMISADGYEPADEKRMERVVKDAFMSAGRAVDSLLLFLEADAKGRKLFTSRWSSADAFYLHKDLLFQTARVLSEFLDIKGERMAYVELVRDIRFCQNTYLKPRVGGKLLRAVVEYANNGMPAGSDSSSSAEDGLVNNDVYEDLLQLLRTALAFYVEGRRTELAPVRDKLARRDSMTDAQQAMAMACEFIAGNLDALGEPAIDTPVYKKVKDEEARQQLLRSNREMAHAVRHQAYMQQQRKKLFTAFPATHRNPETI